MTLEYETAATKADLEEARELLALMNLGCRPMLHLYADAPVLDDWKIVPARVPPAAAGIVEFEAVVSGHPDFADGTRIRTTPLLMRSEEKGWARTMTRYWRVGTPAAETLN